MINIVVPQLGESVVEARIARWLKKEGDHVDIGEPVVELETEKIDLEVSAERAGVIASIERREGEDVKIGELLATIDEAAAGGNGSRKPSAPAVAASAPAPQETAADDAARSTPAARRMAKEHAVNLDGAIQGKQNSITVNFRYFLDGVNNIESENVILQLIDGMSPCVARGYDDGQPMKEYLYIVMPIRQ